MFNYEPKDYDKLYEEYEVLWRECEKKIDDLTKQIEAFQGIKSFEFKTLIDRRANLLIIYRDLAETMYIMRQYTKKYRVDRLPNFKPHGPRKVRIERGAI